MVRSVQSAAIRLNKVYPFCLRDLHIRGLKSITVREDDRRPASVECCNLIMWGGGQSARSASIACSVSSHPVRRRFSDFPVELELHLHEVRH